MTKIKICGLKRPEDIQAVNEAKPDFAGFVIEVPKSRRNVSAEQARKLVKGLSEQIRVVGVFVNAPLDLVAGLLNDGTLALAQLHGSEDETYIRQLRQMTDKSLIQAFSIRSAADIEQALQSSADYLLLDQGGGGTGQCFDWSLVPELARPFFLAGGLSVSNLSEAISQVKPWAVDLSSSLETDGVKDPIKIQAAVKMVRTRETGSW